jgi:signal transduction histidine kinase
MLIAAVSMYTLQASAQRGSDADMGIPFFENFTANQYNAHNRNFDVICDREGHTYFANFEGLLVYDNVEWRIVHTPDISRVTGVSIDENGNVRFEGVTFTGYVESVDGDSIRVFYTRNDGDNTQIVEGQSSVDRWNDIEVYQRLRLSDDRTLLATATDGVIAVNGSGSEIWRVTVDNGLCSNSITKLAYDGKGTVWGATDNGVFRLSVQEMYTHFSEKEGLRGQVSCIARSGGSLIVGTFQGLYRLEGQKFRQIDNVSHACWQIQKGPGDILYVATQNGVYEYRNGHASQLTKPFTLSVMVMEDGTWLAGELERICRYRGGEEMQVLGNIPNITRFKADGQRGLWAMTLSGEYYYLEAGKDSFEKKSNGPISKLFEYEDNDGNLWQCYDNGMGLRCENMTDELKKRIEPFSNYSVQAMLSDDGIIWIADNRNLVRFNMEKGLNRSLFQPQLFIRDFNLKGQDLNISFSNDKFDAIGHSLYSYRLHADGEWSRWNEQQQYIFANLSYGNYQVSVRSIDAFGQVSETEPMEFKIPLPFYMRWYALLVYFIIIVFVVFQWFKIRMRHLQEEQQRLEAIVDERTKEVVKQKDEIEAQKDEIEEKSHKLEETLGELRSAQDKLLRQEREAAIGKLTKGLIDRILNPMNYINNFAHLTLGLSKEMRDNIEDEKDNITPDTYEDAMDVMDMMKTNLEKIEQHGISTTRTLKAMEEMLKERSQKIESTDVALLCQQCVDKFRNYYTDDITALGIQLECVRPESPLMLNVVADQLNKSIMSMLSNSIYAIRKKAEKGGEYKPVMKVTVQAASGGNSILIYDNGIGIEKSIIDKIFDPFFTTKPTAEAPGVGLYLSQQALHDWGGSITVDSVKDEYTEFKISFA